MKAWAAQEQSAFDEVQRSHQRTAPANGASGAGGAKEAAIVVRMDDSEGSPNGRRRQRQAERDDHLIPGDDGKKLGNCCTLM